MADSPNVEDVRKDLEKQIADLKKEVAKIGKLLPARGDDLREETEGAYDRVTRRARGAGKQARQQAHAVSEAIKENPGTAASVLSAAGVVGFLIGLFVGHALSGNSRRWY
ncbi:hypothetical protein [Nitratireductor luteus]|uniref:hypothetical protein n=1 Tax=Nitratireductor luteus TaxID=2976980 RepID=UPI002240B35D|nr:hypothetical protein [Nitratireductor luteus]